jgi:hypothetical protein
MSPDEILAIQKAAGEAERTSWEQTRTICYWSVVAMQGNKDIPTPKDLFKLPWDKNGNKG